LKKSDDSDDFDIRSFDIKSAIGRWTKDRFVLRSSFYTGRGVNAGDLNSEMLENIYQGLKADVSQDAATNFAKFVNGLTDLSASAFIQAFERFWYGGCQKTEISQGDHDGNRLTGRGDALIGEGLALIANALGGRRSSQTEIEAGSQQIKSSFLMHHQEETGFTAKFISTRLQREGWY
jgi:hypothetical protein